MIRTLCAKNSCGDAMSVRCSTVVNMASGFTVSMTDHLSLLQFACILDTVPSFLTLPWRSGLAPAFRRSSTTFWWPWMLACCSAVQPFCMVEWVIVSNHKRITVWLQCTFRLVSLLSSSDQYAICYNCSYSIQACSSDIHEIKTLLKSAQVYSSFPSWAGIAVTLHQPSNVTLRNVLHLLLFSFSMQLSFNTGEYL